MAQLTINYTANSDLSAFSTWLTTNVASSTYDSTTQEGTLTLNDGVTTIGNSAFQNCTALLTLKIPEGITIIDERAFYGSANLTYVELPSTLTSLKNTAFWNNSGLRLLRCNAVTPPSITGSNFSNPNDILYVPIGSLSAYQNSDWNSKFSMILEWTGNAVITYHSSMDLSNYSSWITNNAISTTYDSTTQIGTIEVFPYEIGTDAFRACTTLTEVEITNIIKIGQSAFMGCTSITSVTLPNSLTSIVTQAFQGCTSLTSITLPSSLTIIGSNAFQNCTGITSINLPNSITEISNYAFKDCTSLSTFTIPSSTTLLYRNSFENTSWWNNQLDEVLYKDGWCLGYKTTKPTGDVTISVDKIAGNAFQGCTGITSINLPSSLTSISTQAFSGCTGITSINLPSSLTSIGTQAFSGCTSLTTIYWNAENVTTYQGYAYIFSSCPISTVVFGDSVQSIPYAAFQGCTGITSINLPSSLTSIKNQAFLNCTSLTTIYWNAENVTTYAGSSNIFGSCPISTVVFGDSVQSIPSQAFKDCTGITSITFPSSLTSIGSNAFQGCTGITSINLPSSLTSIGTQAFSGCTSLTTIYWNAENVTTYAGSSNIFGSCPISTVVFGDSVQSIPYAAFQGCTGITSINLPSSLTSIGGSAFSGCTGITSINLPSSLTSIGQNAFSNCTSLTTIYWNAENITTYNTNAFGSCPISTVVFGDSVQSIPYAAFQGNTSLTSITLPGSLTSIGAQAFLNCTNLLSVTCLATTPPALGNANFSVFGDTLYVPIASKSAYQNASNWSTAFTYYVGLCEVTSTVTGSGSVSPSSTTLNEGDDVTLTIYPSEGYAIYSVTDNGNEVEIESPMGFDYTIENIAEDHTITVVFKQYYYIGIQVVGSGTVSSPEVAFADEDFEIYATPDEGFDVSEFVVDGVNLGRSTYDYMFQAVDSDHSVEVVFSPLYNINIESTEGGTVDGPETALEGDDVTLTITPDTGYSIVSVTDNGTSVQVTPSGMTYTISNIQDHHTVSVVFAALYTVSTTTTEGGSISPESSTVVAGSDVTLTITPDEGMLIFNVLDNDTPVPVLNPLGMTYTISNIQENHTVEAIFMVAQNYGFDLSEMIDTDFMIQTLDELQERK